ncbi:tetratricopeptide repeat protein 36 homolog [Toxorhynchites rutilus septentrionalis]|uniref:tetratricopeptide repeat protein 36 homolog n=1 Tax=Toxorhynchites rutilus septentrionalis TaxID=329112 RepID=UPI00247A9D9C|nr:tetratricopeptide repeat protein 36 homolog [Toxorhynchites rutilus septentrionalis]
MTTISQECLSDHDRQVLESIFNPSQIGGEELLYNGKEEFPEDLQDLAEPNDPRIRLSKKFELEAIQLTEEGKLPEAINLFNRAIETAPERPAPWNNRAQAYRYIGNEKAALDDIEQALKLSKRSGRTGCRALCQRGVLRRKNKDTDGAREDFEEAAKLGSQFARTQLIELNPYAALCNQMLREVMKLK